MREGPITSFWEHVEDLRQTLIRSLVVIGLGFFLLVGFYPFIIQFLTNTSVERSSAGLQKQKVERVHLINSTLETVPFELPNRARLISTEGQTTDPTHSSTYYLKPGQSLIYEEVITAPLLIIGPMEGVLLVFK